ncbi:MAG TPA: glutamate--tRNA ligase [Candidatus Nanoarchaeia archaeon]|nr:glutamate--tRNA ligase [Candidatus Nanoarchaeia archaeon]
MDDSIIRKYALQNAVRFAGKASPGAIIGKLIAEQPEFRQQLKDISLDIQRVVAEVNRMSPAEQHAELQKLAPGLLEKKAPEKRELPSLRNAAQVCMRFEPSPSGGLHVGHAYVLGLNHLYTRRYRGKLILRIADTNPENIYPEAYRLIEEDARWLTHNGIAEVAYQSDRMEAYYLYMEKLLDIHQAYICTCDSEEFRRLIRQQAACPCRDLPAAEQKTRWQMMFTYYKQGEAVVRLKTDIRHKNPAMRDFPLFRINEEEHARTKKKYRVWPLMNLAVAVDDLEMGITHIVRAKDHADNAKRQRIIYGYLGKHPPENLFVGRINFTDMPVSATQISKGIREKRYIGWDDIRLPSLAALRRRGFQPEALLTYAGDVGVSLTDKTVTRDEFFKSINAFNKQAIDAAAHRYFFVWDPQEIKIEGAAPLQRDLDLHPDNRKGGRRFETHDRFLITKTDFAGLREGKLYRLMECLNFVQEGSKFRFHSADYQEYKQHGAAIIHWLPKSRELVPVEVLMPDGKSSTGLGEPGLRSLKKGEVVQLERFGFCRLDETYKSKLVFWFGHP